MRIFTPVMNAYLSDKVRVVTLFTMVLLTLVHAYTYPSNTFTGVAMSLDGLVFAIQYFISQGLAKFRVPMFFILSGYFFVAAVIKTKNGSRIQFIKRLRTIALPYLLWSLIGLLAYGIMQWPETMRAFFPNNQVWGLSPVQLLEKILVDPIPYQLWFLRDLMILFALTPLIQYVVRRVGILAILPPTLTWLFEVDLVILDNGSLPFYMAGAWLAMRGPSREPCIRPRQRLVIVIGWLALLALKTGLVLTRTVDGAVIRQIHHLAVLWGLVAVWVGYDLLVKDRDVKQLALYPLTRFSFFLYVSHEPLLTVVKKILFMLPGHGPMKALLVYFAAPTITISACFAVAAWLLRHAPRTYSLLTGGRGALRKATTDAIPVAA